MARGRGVRELRIQFDRLTADLERAAAQAVAEEAEAVKQDERSWVPVLTGELRDGIDIRRDGQFGRQVGIFDPTLWWGVLIEYGRKNAPAQPFVAPAYEASRRRFPDRMRRTLSKAVRDAQR